MGRLHELRGIRRPSQNRGHLVLAGAERRGARRGERAQTGAAAHPPCTRRAVPPRLSLG